MQDRSPTNVKIVASRDLSWEVARSPTAQPINGPATPRTPISTTGLIQKMKKSHVLIFRLLVEVGVTVETEHVD